MSSQRILAVVPIMIFAGLGSSSCASEDPAAHEEEGLGAQTQAVESYFCVDHPCADLHPRKYGECYRPGGTSTMIVAIENIGPINAGQSKAKFWVDYYGYSQTYDVPPIAAGARYNLSVTLPSFCRVEPGCTWGVLADATNLVREINGGNNKTVGACIY